MTKTTNFIIIFLMLSLSLQAQTGIKFNQGSFEELKAEAAKNNKIIFVDAYATWCGPCKWMAANVFTDEKVGEFHNANFVNAKIDMEKGEGIELAKQFQVTAYPTLIYLDANGVVVHRGLGARDANALMALGKVALDPNERLGGQLKKYEAGTRSKDFLFGYVKAIMDANMPFEKPMVELYKQLNESEILSEKSWDLLREGLDKSEGYVWETFAKYKNQFGQTFGEKLINEKAEEVLTGTAYQVYKNGGNIDELKTVIKSVGISDPEKILGSARVSLAWRKKEYTVYAKEVVDYFKKFPEQSSDWLNMHAWNFYEQVTDKNYVSEAVKMSKKAVDTNPNYALMDTYAALLHKSGNNKDALVWADKAIAKGKEAEEDVSGTEELKQKIKQVSAKK